MIDHLSPELRDTLEAKSSELKALIANLQGQYNTIEAILAYQTPQPAVPPETPPDKESVTP